MGTGAGAGAAWVDGCVGEEVLLPFVALLDFLGEKTTRLLSAPADGETTEDWTGVTGVEVVTGVSECDEKISLNLDKNELNMESSNTFILIYESIPEAQRVCDENDIKK